MLGNYTDIGYRYCCFFVFFYHLSSFACPYFIKIHIDDSYYTPFIFDFAWQKSDLCVLHFPEEQDVTELRGCFLKTFGSRQARAVNSSVDANGSKKKKKDHKFGNIFKQNQKCCTSHCIPRSFNLTKVLQSRCMRPHFRFISEDI